MQWTVGRVKITNVVEIGATGGTIGASDTSGRLLITICGAPSRTISVGVMERLYASINVTARLMGMLTAQRRFGLHCNTLVVSRANEPGLVHLAPLRARDAQAQR